MNAKMVLQENPATGETNLHFITDPVTTVEDVVLSSGTWAKAKLSIHPVTIEGSDEALKALGTREFRCVDNVEGEETGASLKSERIREMLDTHVKKEADGYGELT